MAAAILITPLLKKREKLRFVIRTIRHLVLIKKPLTSY